MFQSTTAVPSPAAEVSTAAHCHNKRLAQVIHTPYASVVTCNLRLLHNNAVTEVSCQICTSILRVRAWHSQAHGQVTMVKCVFVYSAGNDGRLD